MAEILPIGGAVHLSSDVRPLAEEMYHFMELDGAFEAETSASMLIDKLYPELTEWERHHQNENEPVYRMRFRKVREPTGSLPEFEFRDTNPLRVNDETKGEEELQR